MDTQILDDVLEQICQQGCRKVNLILQQLQSNQRPDELNVYSEAECAYLRKELTEVMRVYDNNCCEI